MEPQKAQRGIIPQKIKGFRDIDPALNQLRAHIVEKASQVYARYGFEKWDTPVLEYADALGKYMPDTATVEEGVYSFQNPEAEPVLDSRGKEMSDHEDKVIMEHHHLALRYDLTAPLARVYAERLWMKHLRGQVSTANPPLFRRFQHGPVYRYEIDLDPGRFREFWQLDFDTVGSADVAADAEVCMVLSQALEAIGMPRETFQVKVNNRKVLKGLLRGLGVLDDSRERDILRVIDKLDKVGLEAVRQELGAGRVEKSGAPIAGLGLPEALVEAVGAFFVAFEQALPREQTLARLDELLPQEPVAREGLDELRRIHELLAAAGFDDSRARLDPTLVRGMAYYTGPIFEVESLLTVPGKKGQRRKVGAICGGGRYDSLVERLLGFKVPATGASIGVDRLAELLVLSGQARPKATGPALVVVFDEAMMPEYQKLAAEIRAAGLPAEVFYGAAKNLKKQFAYADERDCPVAVMLGEDELAKGVVTVKDLVKGRQSQDIQDKDQWRREVQFEVERAGLAEKLRQMLLR